MPDHRGDLWIANTVSDLIQGDAYEHEHLPREAIPLDNDELTFLPNAAGKTTIWKCQASDGGIRALQSGDGSAHFPRYSGHRIEVMADPELRILENEPLQANNRVVLEVHL